MEKTTEELRKEEALKELEKQDLIVLERLVELSKSEKAKNFLKSTLQFAVLKSYLGKI